MSVQLEFLLVLVAAGIVLALLALAALIPTERLPSWLGICMGAAVACGILVVVALST